MVQYWTGYPEDYQRAVSAAQWQANATPQAWQDAMAAEQARVAATNPWWATANLPANFQQQQLQQTAMRNLLGEVSPQSTWFSNDPRRAGAPMGMQARPGEEVNVSDVTRALRGLLPQAGTLTPELQQQMQTPGYMQDLLNKVLYSLPIRWRPAGLVPPENIGQYMGNLPAGTALGLSGALNQPSLFEPGFQGGILPQQRPAGLPEGYKLPDNRQRTGWFEYPAEQIYNTMQWASQWMPGGERGVADRRTVAQQKQFQNELQAMLDWQMPAAPRPPGVPAYLGGDVTGEKNAAAMRSYQKAMAEYNLDMQRRAEAEAAWKQWMPVVQEMVAPETIQGGASYMTQPPVEQTLQGGPYRALAWQPQLSTQTARQWRFEPRWGQ